MNRPMRSVCWLALVAVCLCVSVSPGMAQDDMGSAPIDPVVPAEFDIYGEATFFVLFKEQADLSPAYDIRDWSERGWFVYRRLVETAESSQSQVRTLLDAWGAETRPFWIVNAIEVRTEHRPLLSLLAARPEVEEIVAPPAIEAIPIEIEPEVEASDSRTIGWNIEDIRAPLVWSTYGVRGAGIVVGVIDLGGQYDHPALVRQYRGNMGGGVFDHNYNWYDPAFVCGNPSNVPCDNNGHGTATAGLAVGEDEEQTNQIGVAPGAKFMMAAIDGVYTDALPAMEWILAPMDLNGENPRPDLRPHVVNNSWGTLSGFAPFLQDAVRAWRAAGMFPVFAMGNEGPSCETGRSPGDYPESYAVGAHDVDDDIWVLSSRGPSEGGAWIIKPNITAPGVSVRTSVPGDLFQVQYEYGTGTSFATPHVVGTVALMWSLNPDLVGQVATTWLHLDHGAIDVSDLSCGGEPGNNNVWGEGRLDAFAAVSFLLIDGFESGDCSGWSAEGP